MGSFTPSPDSGIRTMVLVFSVIILLCLVGVAIRALVRRARSKRTQALIRELAGAAEQLSPAGFEALYATVRQGNERRHGSGTSDFPGAFVARDATEGRAFAGAGDHVMRRLSRELAGKGTTGLHAAVEAGHEVTLSLVRLSDTGLDDLEDLEWEAMRAFDAFERPADAPQAPDVTAEQGTDAGQSDGGDVRA